MVVFRKPANEDIGKLFLRLAVGGLLLFHGVWKIGRGVGFLEQSLASVGLPGFLAYGVFIGEIIAPVLIILGYQARIASLVVALDMLVAILLVRRQDVPVFNDSGGWAIELEVLFLLASVALFFLGSGRYRVTIANDRWDYRDM